LLHFLRNQTDVDETAELNRKVKREEVYQQGVEQRRKGREQKHHVRGERMLKK
jgi:hypothetical protein